MLCYRQNYLGLELEIIGLLSAKLRNPNETHKFSLYFLNFIHIFHTIKKYNKNTITIYNKEECYYVN